ncbi:MAG: tetratricopeptide repeat protein [Pseudomonadota bacterium]|nr:tetratricopeptide repeat protein [Pseudomonadota bacterium]MEC8468319.1 tetratricopeptide repeat protein [Pseudomonadota bacterium]
MRLVSQFFRQLVVGGCAASVSLTLLVIADQGFDASFVSTATAQEASKNERETRKTPALRNNIYEKLAEAQAFAEAKQYVEAEAVLNDMLDATSKKSKLNRYELANVYNTYAYLRYAVEDYDGALDYYQKVIDQRPEIPLALEINTLYTVAQLYFLQENWRKGIDTLNTWMSVTDTPSTNAYVLLANGYFQLKDYDKSLSNIQIAIDREESAGKVPKEQWYNLARFIHFDRDNFREALNVLELLIMYYPKKQYWVQASHLYGEEKDEARQLALLEATYEQNLLDRSQDIVLISQLYLQAEVPYPAARAMEKGLADDIVEKESKNYELAGVAWRQAQEVTKSLPMLEAAASKSEKGELYARLGNVYLDVDKNKEAVEALKRGLDRGGVKRPDQARLALGMAYFNLGDFNAARRAFREARKDKRARSYADQWLRYITSEENRLEELAKDLG